MWLNNRVSTATPEIAGRVMLVHCSLVTVQGGNQRAKSYSLSDPRSNASPKNVPGSGVEGVGEAPAWSTAGNLPDEMILHHTKLQESRTTISTIHVRSRGGNTVRVSSVWLCLLGYRSQWALLAMTQAHRNTAGTSNRSWHSKGGCKQPRTRLGEI